MRGRQRRIIPCLASIVLIALWSSSCFSSKGAQQLSSSHLAATATSYNLAIAQAENEMLLLNAIRAMNHAPMFITDASKVTGTVKLELSLGPAIPWDASAANGNDFMAAPNVDYSTSPAMDVNLLNSKDFMTGFLAPIPVGFFAYYWDREWPAEFMLYLLVLKVDVYEREKGRTDRYSLQCTLHNHPDASDPELEELKGFTSWMQNRLANRRPVLHTEAATLSKIGPLWPPPPPLPDGLAPKDVQFHLDQLATVAGAAPLSLTPDKDDSSKFQLKRDATRYTLLARFAPPLASPYGCSKIEAGGESHDWLQLTEKMPEQIVMGSNGDSVVFALHLRSAEGVLYYLGQLARLENQTAKALLFHTCDDHPHCLSETQPLFVALSKREHTCSGESVSVRALDRKDYFIPLKQDELIKPDPKFELHSPLLVADATNLCSAGRSMMALNLVGQLIGLQKPPATPASGSPSTKAAGGGGAGAKAAKAGKPASGGSPPS
jgi:hypothetical protein